MDTIIREYVESARPVSSQYLGERYDFGICPASIRIEMQKLTDDGFLTQPHTSAGRIPTDRGYRLFVDEVLKDKSQRNPSGKLDFGFEGLEDDFEDIFKIANSLAHSLAAASSSLVLGYLCRQDLMIKDGWEDLLQKPEFGERDLVENFIGYLGYLEDSVKTRKPMNEGMDIYIGKENCFDKADEFAAITFICRPDRENETVFSIVGPKRMAYDKNIELINEALKMFENI